MRASIPRAPRGLAWITLGALFALMTLGNIVSATGSGLACPDWPLCHGRIIPPLEPGVVIEYAHRLAAVGTSVLLIATIALTIRRSGHPGVRRLGVVLLVLLGVQMLLGGVTVLLKLPDLISTTHLVNALLILAGLVVVCAAPTGTARTRDPGPRAAGLGMSPAGLRIGLLVLLAQLALGGYVRHSGAGLACPDFPLCGGDLFPDRWLALVHWIHRWLGVLLVGFFVHLAVAARRTSLATAGWAAAMLAGLQLLLGILSVLLGLPPAVRAAHAAVGYALWGIVVWISVAAGAWRGALEEGCHPRQGLTEAARGV